MARQEIELEFSDQRGRPINGGTVKILVRDSASEVPVYAAASGGSPLAQPLPIYRGQVTGWAEPGFYDYEATVRGQTQPRKAFSHAALGLNGPTGPTGATGPQGIQGETGAPGLVWRGTYGASQSYTPGDVVGDGPGHAANERSFVCVQANFPVGDNIHAPEANGANNAWWELLVEKGDTGATGPQGAQGPVGVAGAGIRHGRFAGDGSILTGAGTFTVSVISTGRYAVTFDADYLSGDSVSAIVGVEAIVTSPGIARWGYTIGGLGGVSGLQIWTYNDAGVAAGGTVAFMVAKT